MRHRATHLLHVLACAPVAALTAATLALPTHAHAASPAPTAPATKPTAYVVAIDPGHGGAPDNSKPDQPFDPGVVTDGGLQEKDLTLDVARRLATLLRADAVKVVLTRNDDSYVDIGPRMQTAIDAGAQLFVSIHFNSFTDPATGGALVLYPNADSLPFAQVMSDALAADLQQAYGVADDGVQSKPDLWVHATMPAVTVEGAYLTNPREAGLVGENAFRDALARAVRDGVEKQAPEILTLKARLLAWQATHHPAPARPAGASASTATNGGAGTGQDGHAVLRWTIILALMAALWRWRRRVAPVVGWACRTAARALREQRGRSRRPRAAAGRRRRPTTAYPLTLATSWASDGPLSRRMPTTQRKRRSARRRAVLQRAARPTPTRRSVYDELWF
jgi:N-acetylmuramoyl-L-alanine amidase